MECIIETSNMEFVKVKGKRVQIVRCVECRFARIENASLVCARLPDLTHLVDKNDFCSRGEFVGKTSR